MSLLPFLLVTARRGDASPCSCAAAAESPTVAGSIALAARGHRRPGHPARREPGPSGAAAWRTTDTCATFLVLGARRRAGPDDRRRGRRLRRDATAVSLGSWHVRASRWRARCAAGGPGRDGRRRRSTALLTLVPSGGRSGATIGMRVLRATVVAGTMAIAATAWIGRDLTELAAQPVVFGLAYLAFALAVAIRFGAIPFHAWAARLTDAVPEAELPLVTGLVGRRLRGRGPRLAATPRSPRWRRSGRGARPSSS